MIDVFYVEYKDDDGDWQPLGVMTMKEAIQWSWENDHRSVNIHYIGDVVSA